MDGRRSVGVKTLLFGIGLGVIVALGAVAGARPLAAKTPMPAGRVGKLPNEAADGPRFALDEDRGFCLRSIRVGNECFDGPPTEGFPTFTFIRGKAVAVIPPESPELNRSRPTADPDDTSIRYGYHDTEIEVRYRTTGSGVEVRCRVLREGEDKLLAIGAGRALVEVPRESLRDISEASLVAPARQGLEIRFAPKPGGAAFSSANHPLGLWGGIDQFGGWNLNANFVALIRGRAGLIVRPREHSSRFLYGISTSDGKERLDVNVPLYFRPRETRDDAMPLLHRQLGFELIPFADENGDRQVDWVDAGIRYRKDFIRKCRNRDPEVREAVIGKLHVGGGYEKLLKGIQGIGFAPQIWWLTGAHVTGGEVYDQKWWTFLPDSSHGDYFAFKREAARCGARIGVHQNLDDVYRDEGWDPSEIRKRPDGSLWEGGVWGGRQAYLRSLPFLTANRTMLDRIDRWQSAWNIEPGDTWHYDVLGAIGTIEDYDPCHPATGEMDYLARETILKHAAKKKILVTSEMTVEGLHEYISFGLQNAAYYHFSEWPAGTGEVVREIPLLPVLFLGRTYTGDLVRPNAKDTLSYAQALLVGAKKVAWLTDVTAAQIQDFYFKQNLLWSKICDQEVRDIDRDGTKYTVTYGNGSVLKVDTRDHSYSLSDGGVVYDGFSPFNSRGWMGVWKDPYDFLLPGDQFVLSSAGPGRHRCVFLPDGRLRLIGFLEGEGVRLLRKIPLRVRCEKPLSAELTSLPKDAGRETRFTLLLRSDSAQRVSLEWAEGRTGVFETQEAPADSRWQGALQAGKPVRIDARLESPD